MAGRDKSDGDELPHAPIGELAPPWAPGASFERTLRLMASVAAMAAALADAAGAAMHTSGNAGVWGALMVTCNEVHADLMAQLSPFTPGVES